MGAAVADAANVAQLALFHHDPNHDDAFMDALTTRARERRAATCTAHEGLELAL
jgi:phosphoribosyl 1,2-cyclic phosphodiesterase